MIVSSQSLLYTYRKKKQIPYFLKILKNLEFQQNLKLVTKVTELYKVWRKIL